MVIDSTDAVRLNLAKEELHRMMESEVKKKQNKKKQKGRYTLFLTLYGIIIQQLGDACLLVFANKQDVKGAMTASQISDALSLTSLKDRQWHIQVGFYYS